MKDLQIRERLKKYRMILRIAAAAILIVLPNTISSSYITGIICKLLIYTILAGSLNVVCGYCDMFCLGHMAFYCIGAYTAAILTTRTDLPYWLVLLLGGILAAMAGFVVFFPIRNLSGAWLSLVTIGFSEIVRLTALNWTGLTGGPMGIKDIPRPSFFGLTISNNKMFYYLFLVFAAMFLFMTSRIVKSRVGYAWLSIKEDKLAAASLGVEVTRYKLMNFLYATFWAGIAGALFAPFLQFIDSSLFVVDEGFSVLCMILIGGLGTIIGPVAGSIIVITLTEVLRFLANYRMVMYGIVIMLMMWIRPQGIFGKSINGMSKSFGHKIRQKRRST